MLSAENEGGFVYNFVAAAIIKNLIDSPVFLKNVEKVTYYGYNEGLFLITSYVSLEYDFEQVISPILDLHICSFTWCF